MIEYNIMFSKQTFINHMKHFTINHQVVGFNAQVCSLEKMSPGRQNSEREFCLLLPTYSNIVLIISDKKFILLRYLNMGIKIPDLMKITKVFFKSKVKSI
jgi:hypothetical protein